MSLCSQGAGAAPGQQRAANQSRRHLCGCRIPQQAQNPLDATAAAAGAWSQHPGAVWAARFWPAAPSPSQPGGTPPSPWSIAPCSALTCEDEDSDEDEEDEEVEPQHGVLQRRQRAQPAAAPGRLHPAPGTWGHSAASRRAPLPPGATSEGFRQPRGSAHLCVSAPILRGQRWGAKGPVGTPRGKHQHGGQGGRGRRACLLVSQ